MSESHKGWKPGREPWCWQPKAALRRIREALDAENAVSSGLLVYVALTEIASDKQSQTFQTTHGYIAGRTGLSARTVQQRIQDLCSIGVLNCVVPSLRAPATYTILTIEPKTDEQPIPRVAQPLHSDVQRLPKDKQPLHSVMQRSKKAPLPTLEESPEESGENKAKNLNSTVALNSAKATPEALHTVDLMGRCKEVFGDEEMQRPDCHRRWLNRATLNPIKLERVLAEIRRMVVEDEIKTTPARAAEDYWKRIHN